MSWSFIMNKFMCTKVYKSVQIYKIMLDKSRSNKILKQSRIKNKKMR